jgi:hypothetical protein
MAGGTLEAASGVFLSLFGIGKIIAARRRRAALAGIDLSDRSRTPLAEQRGVKPIPLRLADLDVLRQLGETDLADEYLAAWEQWKTKHGYDKRP